MTTQKARLTVYLTSAAELDDLREQLRILAPLELRGGISRSTAIEAAVSVALRDVTARGVDSDVYRAMVTLPRCALCGRDASKADGPTGEVWYCQTCGTSDYISDGAL